MNTQSKANAGRLPVFILAGGQSNRFGSDKALAEIQGEPLIKRVSQYLSHIASRTTVIADKPDKYADLGLTTIADLNPGLGPIAGLQTAIRNLTDDETWCLICPCDAIEIKPHWLDMLIAECENALDAVAFKSDRWQPAPALYARCCLPVVDDQIAQKEYSMQRLLDRLATHQLPQPEDWPDPWQINTPEDLAQLRSLLPSSGAGEG